MGVETVLIGSALAGAYSGYQTNRANRKLAKQQLAAQKEAAADAEEAKQEALAVRKNKIDTQREQMGAMFAGAVSSGNSGEAIASSSDTVTNPNAVFNSSKKGLLSARLVRNILG